MGINSAAANDSITNGEITILCSGKISFLDKVIQHKPDLTLQVALIAWETQINELRLSYPFIKHKTDVDGQRMIRDAYRLQYTSEDITTEIRWCLQYQG